MMENFIKEIHCPQGKIKLDLIEDYCEREGGDGNWIRYIHGKVIETPFDQLEKGIEYIFLLEKYKNLYMILDHNREFVMSVY